MAVPNAACPGDALWVARHHKVTSRDLEGKTQGDVCTVTFGCASSGGPSTTSVLKEFPEPAPRKRKLWITHESLNKQSLSLDCPQCEAVLRLSAAGGHSQKCQARIEKALDRNPVDRERFCAAPKRGRWLAVEDLFVDVMEEVEKRRRLEASIGRLEASIGRTSTATRTGASTSTRAGDRGARSSSDLAPAGAPPWRTG